MSSTSDAEASRQLLTLLLKATSLSFLCLVGVLEDILCFFIVPSHCALGFIDFFSEKRNRKGAYNTDSMGEIDAEVYFLPVFGRDHKLHTQYRTPSCGRRNGFAFHVLYDYTHVFECDEVLLTTVFPYITAQSGFIPYIVSNRRYALK